VKRARWLLVLLAWLPRKVEARADFVLVAAGAGFADATPVQPIGGNEGITLGDQRRRALARALEIWGAALDSPVPIVIDATFPDLSCTQDGAVLGQASAAQYVAGLGNVLGGPYYPSALGDRIAGRDLSPDNADITIELNAAIDLSECEDIAGRWYYGFDGKTPDGENDLIQVSLHELAHGLGFASTIDPETGLSQFGSSVDVFTTHVLDLDQNEHWDALSESARRTSVGNVRHLVFDGEQAKSQSRARLATGEPTLALTPMPAGITLTRAVSDVELTTNPAKSSVTGPLVLADPTDACTPIRNDLRGAIALLENGPDCKWQDGLHNLAQAGAIGAVYVVTAPATSPAEPLDAYGYGTAVSLRAVTVSADTGVAISHALTQTTIATLAGDPTRSLGTDAVGRPLLFASQPALRGSSVSHFDSLARPNLLMEAYVQGGSNHDVDLTLAVLRDLGWSADCGNGKLDDNEQCDLGSLNSELANAQCRSNCRLPGCGDGKVDPGEACDTGAANSDVKADACRTDCRPAHCGDGVMDRVEVCDQGIANSDTTPDTCRVNCTLPRCGDGVVDRDESCDGTAGCPATCISVAGAGDAAVASGDAGIAPWSGEPEQTATVRRSPAGCGLASGQGGWLLASLALALRRRLSRGR
jgi:hypothetical protein